MRTSVSHDQLPGISDNDYDDCWLWKSSRRLDCHLGDGPLCWWRCCFNLRGSMNYHLDTTTTSLISLLGGPKNATTCCWCWCSMYLQLRPMLLTKKKTIACQLVVTNPVVASSSLQLPATCCSGLFLSCSFACWRFSHLYENRFAPSLSTTTTTTATTTTNELVDDDVGGDDDDRTDEDTLSLGDWIYIYTLYACVYVSWRLKPLSHGQCTCCLLDCNEARRLGDKDRRCT